MIERLVQASRHVHHTLAAALTNYWTDESNVKYKLDLYDAVMKLGEGRTLMEVITKELERLETVRATSVEFRV